MIFRILIVVIAVGSLFTSCKEQGMNKDKIGGLEYVIHTTNGERKAVIGDFVHFNLTITDDKGSILQKMDAPPQRPVIKIPTEDEKAINPNPIADLLKIVSLGDSASMIIPIDSFKTLPPNMQDAKSITYHIVVKEILSEAENQAYQGELQAAQMEKMTVSKARMPEIEKLVKEKLADYKSGKIETKEDPSGLKYFIIEEGTGEYATVGKQASVHYYGTLMDGTMFDSSFKMGNPYTFPVGRGQVIKGWDIGVPLVKKGGKAMLIIPYTLAYGEAGSPPNIPARADLAFYIEIADVL